MAPLLWAGMLKQHCDFELELSASDMQEQLAVAQSKAAEASTLAIKIQDETRALFFYHRPCICLLSVIVQLVGEIMVFGANDSVCS